MQNKAKDWVRDNITIPCIEQLVEDMEKIGKPKEEIDVMVQQLIDNSEEAEQSVIAYMLKKYLKSGEDPIWNK
jgi:hypothetical protein